MRELRDKVAVVTGGASGIGRAMALNFADRGMHVVIGDVEDEPSATVRAEIESRGVKALALHTDVGSRQAVEELAARAFSEMGGAHVLCNNAGVGTGGPLDRVSDDDWKWVLDVNLYGVVHGLQAFIPRLKEQGQGGHIVNTASMAGMFAMAGLGIYNATKFAVVGISETLHQDLAPYNIGVSVLCPGFVQTDIADARRNRPAGYVPGFEPEEAQEQLRALVDSGMDPALVADRVTRAIENNELYIFTHPEMRDMVEARFANIIQAFDLAASLQAERV